MYIYLYYVYLYMYTVYTLYTQTVHNMPLSVCVFCLCLSVRPSVQTFRVYVARCTLANNIFYALRSFMWLNLGLSD